MLKNIHRDELRSELDSIIRDGSQFFEEMIPFLDIKRADSLRVAVPYRLVYSDWNLLNEDGKASSERVIDRLTLFAPRLMQAVLLSPLLQDEDQEMRMLLRALADSLRFTMTYNMPDLPQVAAAKHLENAVDIRSASQIFMKLATKIKERMNFLSPAPSELVSAIVASQAPSIHKYRPNTAFIMMQISDKIPKLEDIKMAIKEAFKEFGIEAVRSDEIQHAGVITQRILDEIATSEFLMADLTGERPSVYYEVGYAHALGKRPILYRECGTSLHFDLLVHNIPEYRNATDLKIQLRQRLEAMTNKRSSAPLTEKMSSR